MTSIRGTAATVGVEALEPRLQLSGGAAIGGDPWILARSRPPHGRSHVAALVTGPKNRHRAAAVVAGLTHVASAMPNPHAEPATVTVLDKVLVYGDPDFTASSAEHSVEVYDTATGTWSSHATADHVLDAKVLGRKAVFVLPGGQLEVYDAATDAWATTAAPQSFGGAKVAAVGSTLLLAGGYVREPTPEGDPGVPTDAVEMFDTRTGRWTTARLSAARAVDAVAVAGPYAIFAGGFVQNQGQSGPPSVPSGIVDLYDAATGQWSTAQLSEAHWFMIGGTVGTRAFFAGGENETSALFSQAVDIFDGTTGKWSTSHISPGDDYQFAAVGDTVVFGNNNDSGADVLDLATGASSAHALSVPRVHFDALRAVGTKVVFVGGDYGVVPQNESFQEYVDVYDTVAGTWSTATLSQQRIFLRSAVVGNKLVLAGGDYAPPDGAIDVSSAVVDVYDAAAGTWATTSLTNGRDFPAGATVGTRAVFAGGTATYLSPALDDADVFTDATPSAAPVGRIGSGRRGAVTISLTNTGDAPLAAGTRVEVYAAKPASLAGGGVLLGSVTLARSVRPGGSLRVAVPMAIPTSLRAGRYHLLAAADSGAGVATSAFAASAGTFAVSR